MSHESPQVSAEEKPDIRSVRQMWVARERDIIRQTVLSTEGKPFFVEMTPVQAAHLRDELRHHLAGITGGPHRD